MTASTIAVNIALLPDETMRTRARAVNARILHNYPSGFALDERQVPHITLLQAFVKQSDLEAIWHEVRGLEVKRGLRATGFDYYADSELGASGFDINLSTWLVEAHQQVAAAVAPFALPEGDESAFVTTPDEPTIAEGSLNYVRAFFQAHAGDRYHPHLSLGIGQRDYLESLRREAFEPFDFAVEALAMYQLGNFGTCRKLLFTQPR